MTTVIPTDIYDKEGNMLKIEFNDTEGNFVVDVVWDPQDPQDSEHREQLRMWAYKMVKQLGYEVNL
jgi:hypothetical protein